MHFGLLSLWCEEKVIKDSKAVEPTVWTRDGALVFQETFWQILHCDSLLDAQSYIHSLPELCYS